MTDRTESKDNDPNKCDGRKSAATQYEDETVEPRKQRAPRPADPPTAPASPTVQQPADILPPAANSSASRNSEAKPWGKRISRERDQEQRNSGAGKQSEGVGGMRSRRRQIPRAAAAARSPLPPRSPRSSSGESSSSSSLLCALAPRWLQRRRRTPAGPGAPAPPAAPAAPSAGPGWSVTLCGGARTQLPRDVEMRLRFPTPSPPQPRATPPAHSTPQGCACRHCAPLPAVPPAPPRLPPAAPRAAITLHNHSTDSSIVASKSRKKSTDTLPEVETYRSSRSKTKRTVKAVVTDAACLLPALLAASQRPAASKMQ